MQINIGHQIDAKNLNTTDKIITSVELSIDEELSLTSTNPVENSVILNKFNDLSNNYVSLTGTNSDKAISGNLDILSGNYI